MSDATADLPPAGRKKSEPRALSEWVHSMIRAYVSRKAQARTGKTRETLKASGFKDPAYIEAVNKVCMDAFYQIRSRRAHRDFVNYWTSTICSVPQFIREEEFAGVADMLLDEDRWEDVQSLALLALSAESRSAAGSGATNVDQT